MRFLTLSVFFFGCGQNPRKEQPKQEAIVQQNDIPPVTLIREDGAKFSAQELSGNSILIFFGADCDHCQREAAAIRDHLDEFRNYKLYFIGVNPFPVIHDFAKTYGIEGKTNIIFVRADVATVSKVMGYIETPTILIYDEGRRLIKRFDGETEIKQILKVL
jgi:cytochrome oxidase Cu insertion factor (SCO1/SenC/PrrC family)